MKQPGSNRAREWDSRDPRCDRATDRVRSPRKRKELQPAQSCFRVRERFPATDNSTVDEELRSLRAVADDRSPPNIFSRSDRLAAGCPRAVAAMAANRP